MVVPLVTAGWFAYGERSLGHLALLAGVSVLITMWSLITRVRRRLLVGGLGLVAVVAYPVVRAFDSLIRGGASGGTWLAIGAGAAVVLITVGSILERNRIKVGTLLRRAVDLLEEWE